MPFAPTRKLKPGSRVAVVAPSGPFDATVFERGLQVLSSRYTPVLGAHVRHAHRYLAGTAEERQADLSWALGEGDVEAVWAARGGFGAMHLLPGLPSSSGKTIVGFSDVTALHLATQRAGFRSLHAPVVTQLGTQPKEVAERTFAILEGALPTPLQGTGGNDRGLAEGPLLGGNLSLIASLCGTPFLPSLKGAVLLVEDIGERPYRIDRMLTQLRLAGALEGVAGVALGEFTGCEEKDAKYTVAQVLEDLLGPLGVPFVNGLPIGHGEVNHAAPLGARVRLDSVRRELAWLEPLST